MLGPAASVAARSAISGARAALAARLWPGNRRELSSVIERAVILGTRREIDADMMAV